MDAAESVADTWKRNFPKAMLYNEYDTDFLATENASRSVKVDILHMSPPCQPWSKAHSTAGANDEENMASLESCRSLLQRCRPRIATLEETFALMEADKEEKFYDLLKSFVELGFSVTWKLLAFQRLGLPQNRKRAIIIASR
jgi:DNA (cytosine-5)-methyltransferase 1